MKIINEFKAFISRGNVVDLAVGLIMGSAFGKIVSSFVSDILMPPIGLLIGGIDFRNLSIQIKAASATQPAVTINYGQFINTCIDFVIIGFSVFLVIKALNKLQKKEATFDNKPKLSKEAELLTEIRDQLKKTD